MEAISNFVGGGLWGVMIVIAPMVLLAGIVFATIVNRRRTRRNEQISERGTRELYRKIEREDERRG